LTFAKVAHSKGARILIADLKLTSDAEAYIKEANSARNGSVVYNHCDVTKRADLEGVIEKSKEVFGEVPDVYIPGAGVFEPAFSNFWDDPLEDPAHTHGYAQADINLAHPIRFTRLAMRALLGSNKKGVVLLIASIAGLASVYAFPLYAATKWGIVGFTRSMGPAAKLQGVKVVAISPGIIQTPMITDHPDLVDRLIGGARQPLEPEYVVSQMASLIESREHQGGTVLEVLINAKPRVIPLYGSTPPVMEAQEDRTNRVLKPILEVTQRERGVGA